MALATNTSPGEIQLTGDLAGDGSTQSGDNPQLKHLSTISAGDYDFAKITVDEKGRVVGVSSATTEELAALVPAATSNSKGTVQIGSNIELVSNSSSGYQDIIYVTTLDSSFPTGLENSDAVYSVEVTIDGGSVTLIEEAGKNMQSVGELVTILDNAITDAVVSIVNGDIQIQSSSTGQLSSAEVTADSLLKYVDDFDSYGVVYYGSSECEIWIPDASTTQTGVVQIGSGIDVDTNGVISVNLSSVPIATATSLGGVMVPTSNGLSVATDGTLSLDLATSSSVGSVQIGNGLSVDSSGIVTANESEFNLSVATETSTGVIQIGNGLDVDANGLAWVNEDELTFPVATDTSTGVVQIGNGLSVDSSGIVTVNESEFNYPTATETSVGMVQIGSNVNIDTSGIISVPVATSTSLGIVSVGGGLQVTNGTISVDTSSYPVATTTQKGVMQIGQHLNDDAGSGVVGVNQASGSTTFGVVRSANTNNITITSGEVDVGSNVVTIDTQNTWTKAQVSQLDTLTNSASVAIDALQSNTFTITVAEDLTLENPTNLTAGQTITFIIKQGSTGGWALSFGANYLFRGGINPANSSSAGATDLMSCVSDGTKLYCSYNRGFS